MKWIYLPWKYRSADTATKICNIILYVLGCVLLISILTMGYQMFQVHDLSQQESHAQSTQATKEVPVTVDHRQYDYVYHTDTKPYHATVNAIENAVKMTDKHDMSSYTNRVYWLKDYIDQDVLSDNSNPLTSQKLDLKQDFIGFDINSKDQKDIHFILKAKETNESSDDQPNSSLILGTFDGTTQKITSLQKANE